MHGYSGLSGSVRNGNRNQMSYPEEGRQFGKPKPQNSNGTKLTEIKSSGKFCPYCHIMIANGDPNGEGVPGSNGKERRHKVC